MWSEFGYLEETTGDGSPTLRLLGVRSDNKPSESMHHSGGAASETEHIYGLIAQIILSEEGAQAGFRPRFLSLGLGLGYVEMTLAREALKYPGKPLESLVSFESEQVLRDFFMDWVFGQPIPRACERTYDRAAHFVLRNSPWTTEQLKNELQSWMTSKRWVMGGEIEKEVSLKGRFSGIFYDAFSAKTSQSLWSEAYLENFLSSFADSNCLFSTYASLGALKRALKNQDFQIIKRKGFAGKRNSTFAFKSLDHLKLLQIFAHIQ
jgi:hypothetical protein